MKPGLTCLWQISARNELDFDQWMKLDLAVHRQLVALARPQDPAPDRPGGAVRPRRLVGPPAVGCRAAVSPLPGLYVGGCVLALALAVRRWLGEPLPWRAALATLFLVLAVFHPVLFRGQLLLPLDNLRG